MTPEEIKLYGEPLTDRRNCAATATYQRCSQCKQWLLYSKFGPSKDRPRGIHNRCMECSGIKGRRSVGKQRDVRRAERRKAIEEQYGALIAPQSKTTATHKYCPRCETWKLHCYFGKSSHSASGLGSYCRDCLIKIAWVRRLKHKYGMAIADYEAMVAQQGGVCKICGGVNDSKHAQPLFVDHCHATGKVRGLLCHNCNTSLGLMRDDTARLQKAIDYLESTQ